MDYYDIVQKCYFLNGSFFGPKGSFTCSPISDFREKKSDQKSDPIIGIGKNVDIIPFSDFFFKNPYDFQHFFSDSDFFLGKRKSEIGFLSTFVPIPIFFSEIGNRRARNRALKGH